MNGSRLNSFRLHGTQIEQLSTRLSEEKSTETALNEIRSAIYEALDRSEIVLSVLLDCSKAFDCVDHSILLEKLKRYGITSSACKWIESYLNHRMQSVRVGIATSNQHLVPNGVPQGSILGPLLFCIFINDVTSAITDDNVKIYMYADDVQLQMRSKGDAGSIELSKTALSTQLNRVLEWTIMNKLKLNAEKSKLIIFANQQKQRFLPQIQLNFDQRLLNTENSVKNLGLIMDNSMSLAEHINYCCEINKWDY